MRLYIFKSDAKSELRAFAADLTGSKLPDQFRPWHAIETHGFQLWRMKTSATSQSQPGEVE